MPSGLWTNVAKPNLRQQYQFGFGLALLNRAQRNQMNASLHSENHARHSFWEVKSVTIFRVKSELQASF